MAVKMRGLRVRASLKGMQFFDKELELAVGKGVVRPLNRIAATVRLRAKGRIRRPRRKKKSELNQAELVRYHIAKDQELESGVKAQLPFQPSAAGEPPRSHSRLLPNNIYYAYDKTTKSVWVGPIAFRTRPGEATGALEHGGQSIGRGGKMRQIAARPYMKPSLDQIVESEFVKAFEGCLKRN